MLNVAILPLVSCSTRYNDFVEALFTVITNSFEVQTQTIARVFRNCKCVLGRKRTLASNETDKIYSKNPARRVKIYRFKKLS